MQVCNVLGSELVTSFKKLFELVDGSRAIYQSKDIPSRIIDYNNFEFSAKVIVPKPVAVVEKTYIAHNSYSWRFLSPAAPAAVLTHPSMPLVPRLA
jgi:hypothetical protein